MMSKRDELFLWWAKWFAIVVHTSVNQRYRSTGDRWWWKMERAAHLIDIIDGDIYQKVAAWLHDTVEDTWVPLWLIKLCFGKQVAELVKGVTDVSTEADGDRRARKAKDLMHFATQSARVKTVKLADIVAGLTAVEKHMPDFTHDFMAEKKTLLSVLRQGDMRLYEMANTILQRYFHDRVINK